MPTQATRLSGSRCTVTRLKHRAETIAIKSVLKDSQEQLVPVAHLFAQAIIRAAENTVGAETCHGLRKGTNHEGHPSSTTS